MLYRLAADLVLALHLGFVVFVVLGGALALRWPKIIRAHIPAAVWGVLIEFGGWICPLTPLENALRTLGGESGYEGGFIEHYLLPALYPSGLTRDVQIWLGIAALVPNAFFYTWYFIRRARASRAGRDLKRTA
jgi:hypothetical protein